MKKLKFYIVILNFILLVTNLFAQNGGTKPLMKLTVKDGKVIKNVPYDSTKNLFKISNFGKNNILNPDKTIRTSINKDINYNPNKAIRTSSFELLPRSLKTGKGNNFPEIIEYSKALLDLNSVVKISTGINNDKEKTTVSNNTKSLAGWETIIAEDFEGDFPGVWDVYAGSGFTDAYWDDQDYRVYGGSWSGYCADEGTESVGLGGYYPNDMDAWMIYGPFDLSDATDALLTFMNWNDTESGYDYFKYMVSIDGTDFYGTQVSGYSGGWVSRSLDFKNISDLGDITGEPEVWIAFQFTSDFASTYEGSYIDDIVLEKNTVAITSPDLTWTSMDLSTDTWTVGNSVTADLEEVNNGTGSADYHYTRLYLSTDYFISSYDTQLGTDLSFSSIMAGEYQTQSKTFIVPDVSDGTYYVGAIVDYYDDVSESDETNNTLYRTGQITTSQPDVPSAPAANAATNVLQTSFNANWSSSATEADGYLLDVATNTGFTTFVAGFYDKDVSNVTTFNVTGLSAKTHYYYRVRAYNSYGTSENSNIISLTTLTNPSSVPSGLTASSCNDLITLKWRKSTGPDFIRYRIYGGTTNNPTTKIDSTSNSISDTSIVLSGGTRGQTYYFRVTAVNYDGSESNFSDQSSTVVKTGVVPRIKVKWGDLLICYNQGDSIKSFQWYKGSMTITGETKQYYQTNKASGVYKVETIDLNGCRNSSIPVPIPISGTSSFSVYPNPASVSFTLKINDESEGRAVVSIINSAGIKVMEFQTETINDELLKEIPVNNLDEGIYFVQVLLNHKDLYYTKIVIIK